MAEGTLKEQALATIQAGRRELGAEAEWLRRKMNPKTIAAHVAHEHGVALAVGACVMGIGLSWMMVRSWKHHHEEAPRSKSHPPQLNGKFQNPKEVKVGAVAYLTGLLLKAARPLLIKGGLQILRNWGSFSRYRGSRGAVETVEA